MKTKIILLFYLITCLSCASNKKDAIRYSSIKLEGEKTNIRDFLDIDGMFDNHLIFFDDGSFVSISRHEFGEDKIVHNLSDSLQFWKEKGKTRWGNFWGVYTLQNDTLITHLYDKGAWYKAWGIFEKKYKIEDRKKIKKIYSMNLLLTEDEKNRREKSNYYLNQNIENTTLHFIPANGIPAPDNWLKEEKWIWRNESDWKEYIDRIKQEKVKK